MIVADAGAGAPPLTDRDLLRLLEGHTPRELALLFTTDTETVAALTGLDFAWWWAGIDEASGTVAFFKVDPDTRLPTGAIVCVADDGRDEAALRAEIGETGYPYTLRLGR